MDTVMKVKRELIKWEKIFADYTSDKRLVCRVYKELSQLNSFSLVHVVYEGDWGY